MKNNKLFLLSLVLLSSLTGCGKMHDPIPYEDKLPTVTKDGNILHAFNWSYNIIKENLPSIAEAGFTTVQTSPVQQPKAGGGSWWSLYQPVSFSIAVSSPLGTKDELKSLCEEADKYGVKIIADIVFNHLATNGEYDENGLPVVDPEVKQYEPEIYDNQSHTFHQKKDGFLEGGSTTQCYSGLPDLNTSNELVQSRSLDLLKECIDVGVDGFRFDAAKHIETEKDKNYASNFWSNTLGEAKKYYKEKTGNDLFAYGEILNDVEGGSSRSLDNYTNHMLVTDNSYANTIYSGLLSKNGQLIATAYYGKNTNPSNLVTWVESHDTYVEQTNHINERRVAKSWAIIASRKDSRSLYFARPNDSLSMGEASSFAWSDELVGVTNRFHNRFIGAEENLQSNDTIVYNERYSENDYGAILVNLSSDNEKVSTIKFSNIPDGIYYDSLSGNQVKVKNGKAEVTFDENGIIVLTLTETIARPRISVDKNSCMFADKLTVTLNSFNAEESTYQINNEIPVPFNGETKITIGENADANEEIVLTVYARNGEYTKTRKMTYTKLYLYEGYVNILNLKPEYLTDYELYIWAWGEDYNPGTWLKNYEVREDRVLVSFGDTKADGFLLAIFPKGYEIENLKAWDKNLIKQSSDIKANALFFDASSF